MNKKEPLSEHGNKLNSICIKKKKYIKIELWK